MPSRTSSNQLATSSNHIDQVEGNKNVYIISIEQEITVCATVTPQIFLPTLKVRVMSPAGSQESRLLLDSASTWSFISMVAELELPTMAIPPIRITAFGGITRVESISQTAELKLYKLWKT